VELRRIDRHHRQPEATLRHESQQALPGILGGLLDLAATVHQRLETISVDEPPRMADYGRTLAAVDEALASNGLRRYLSRADQLSEDSLSADPFIEQLRLHTRAARRQVRWRPAGDDHTGWRPLAAAQGMAEERPGCHRDSEATRAGARSLGWAIEDDNARNHRNVLLWTI
jgi:hypothetical protein